MEYFYVFVAQIAFNLLKVLEIRYTVYHEVIKVLMVSFFLAGISLASIFISIESLLNGDVWIILFFLAGSLIGKYFGMRIQVNAPMHRDIIKNKLLDIKD